jgi:pimeloyl-ACP methyl ester carboxylesterase
VKEQAIQFGKSAMLSGILADPTAEEVDDGRPAFILLNSGILHRVGSCRLHVRLARALSRQGFTSLRFDFSGMGDSETRRDNLSFEDACRSEVREAMDFVASARGARHFVLLGLCSGADMAHLAAAEDDRVAGLMFIDPWAYRTRRYWFTHYAQRVFKADVWKNWARIRVRRMLGEISARRPAQSTESVTYDVPKYVREFPSRETVARDLAGFMRRDIRMLVVFTAGMVDHYNHASQYRRSFPEVDFSDRLQVEFLPTSDHIITNLAHQEFVVRRVAEWAATVPVRTSPRSTTPQDTAATAALR